MNFLEKIKLGGRVVLPIEWLKDPDFTVILESMGRYEYYGSLRPLRIGLPFLLMVTDNSNPLLTLVVELKKYLQTPTEFILEEFTILNQLVFRDFILQYPEYKDGEIYLKLINW